MKLSAEQIKQIDYVLAKHYSFENFDDVRIELVDHIATDIEFEMKNNQILFEDALNSVLFKWKAEISWDRNSKHNTVPKMISKLWNKLDWKYNYCVVPLTAILCFVAISYSKETWLTYVMYSVGCVGLVLGGYLIYLFRKNRFNTVLSMYAKNQIKIYVGLLALALIANLAFNYSYGDFIDRPLLFVVIQFSLVIVMRSIIMRKNIKIENQLLKVL